MEWLAETPLYTIMIGSLMTGFFALVWFVSKQRIFFALSVLTVIGVVAGVVIERWIITDREQLRENIFLLAEAVESNNVADVVKQVSQSTPQTIRRIQNEMPDYNFRKCRIIGFNYIDLPETKNPARASVDFVVRFNVDATQTHGYDGSGIRRITLTFEKQGDLWKVIDYHHEHPQSRRNLRL
ncbi:MAG: hypothetical protein MK106_07010 [Mariniblastus sp.]|nr:hypothetical protein [Mariniblastus sp.]